MTPIDTVPELSAGLSVIDAIQEIDRLAATLAVVSIDGGPTWLVSRDSLIDYVIRRPLEPGAGRDSESARPH
jgi:hypothetical protein